MKLKTIPRIKGIDLRRKRFQARRRLFAHKRSWLMRGGPLHKAWLCSPGTLRFSYQQWRGYYDQSNKWVSL